MASHPLIIGHRGACGYLPEHTLESFQRAVDLGADAIETDVVLTRDGQLLCRHDCELSLTTNVADRPEFASRRIVRSIDGMKVRGWFSQDFSLDETHTLLARERFNFRNRTNDDRLNLASLDELLGWAMHRRTRRGLPLMVIIEIKHAAHFESNGLSMEDAIVKALSKFSLAGNDSTTFIESFEIDILRKLHARIKTPIIQLLDAPSIRPADVTASGGSTTYRDMLTSSGLSEIATYAQGIGAWKRLIVPEKATNMLKDEEMRLKTPTTLIEDAHAAGLFVHAWTFRNEIQYLADHYDGDARREYRQFADLGLDGYITDFPDTALAALSQ